MSQRVRLCYVLTVKKKYGETQIDLSKIASDIEGLFQFLGVLIGIVILAAIICAIVFGGAITTFFGSMMGAALNRTIAEQEYLEQADKQEQPVSVYHTEGEQPKFNQPVARGCSLQIVAALAGGAMLWSMFVVFMERNFGRDEFWTCVAVSCFTAGVVYHVRQTRRKLLLPAELANQGRVPLYLTWLYICMFFNVILAGIFGLWGLGVTSVLALALLGLTRNNSTPTAPNTKDDLEDYYPE